MKIINWVFPNDFNQPGVLWVTAYWQTGVPVALAAYQAEAMPPNRP